MFPKNSVIRALLQPKSLRDMVTFVQFLNKKNMKKLLALFLSLVILGPTVYASTFTDLSDNYYNNAIEYVSERGIVNGYEDGTFQPSRIVNRAELLKIIISSRYEESEYENYGEDCFKDVRPDSWYAPFICFAKEKNIIDGYSDGTFRPDQQVNFVEALKMTLENFDFEYDTSSAVWYEGLVNKATNERFIPQDVSSADQYFNRGQTAELITRVLKEREDGLNDYLKDSDEGLKVPPITYNVSKSESNDTVADWGWKLAPTAEDAYNFINGFDSYSSSHKLGEIAAAKDGFYIFYRSSPVNDSTWGWKLASDMEDASNFLNRKGAYTTGNPKNNIRVAKNSKGFYIFYQGENSSANWGIKKSTDIDDMYDFVNGHNSYDNSLEGVISGTSEKDSYLFYRSDLAATEGWGWKKATTVDDAYNFLNGIGSYGEPLNEVKIFAEDTQWGPFFYIFYKSSDNVVSTTQTPPISQPVTVENTDLTVSFGVGVNDYPDSNPGKNLANAYVNVYEVTPVKSGVYNGKLIQTLSTGSGSNPGATVTADYGKIINFVGFKEKSNADKATTWTFSTPPFKNFGDNDQLCQINYLNTSQYLNNDKNYACANSLSTPYQDEESSSSVVFEVAVNDYPDHDPSRNLANVYVNVYEVTPVKSGVYYGTLLQTISTGAGVSPHASVTVEYGKIMNFIGFKDKASAERATSWTFSTPPYKNFGDNDQLCQINFLETSQYLQNDSSYACANSLSTPYQSTEN